jgi:RNA polymerase sigma-70 factor (ECF subfamily)
MLSRREAEVVACIDVVGLDVSATARALGMTPTGVRVARHRALGRLRRMLPSDGRAVLDVVSDSN